MSKVYPFKLFSRLSPAEQEKYPLHLAVFKSDIIKVRHLLEAGTTLVDGLFEGESPLLWAAKIGDITIVKLLIEHRACINKKNQRGVTPLMLAAIENKGEIVKVLIDHGASINIQYDAGSTALMIAVMKNNNDMVKLLLDHGASINIQENEGATALLYAVRNNNTDIVKLLVDHGASINIQDSDGFTALICAAEWNYIGVVQILFGAGANIDLKDSDGQTALDLAKQHHHEGVAKFLQNCSRKKKKTANPEVKSDNVEGYVGDQDIDDVLRFLEEGDSVKLEKKTGNQPKNRKKKKKDKNKNKLSTEDCESLPELVNNPGETKLSIHEGISGNESVDQTPIIDIQNYDNVLQEDNVMTMKELVDVLPENEVVSESMTLADDESGWETVSNPRDTVRSRLPILDVGSSPSPDVSSRITNSKYASKNQVSVSRRNSRSSISSPNKSACAFSHKGDMGVPSISSNDDSNTASTRSESYSVISGKDSASSETVKTGTNTESRNQMPGSIRPIVIDASNVAMLHGVHEKFSVKGIELVVNHFKELGHDVVAMLPKYKSNPRQTDSRDTLLRMEKEKTVVFTPSRTVDGVHINIYDDRMILDYAIDVGAVIITQDNFKDLYEEDEKYREAIKKRILMPTFVGDRLYFHKDPLGRNGPSLHDFLRF